MTTRDGSQTDEPKAQMLIYQSPDNSVTIEVRLEGETVWLTQQQMAELFQSSRSNIVEHIGNIYAEDELDEEATCREFRQVRREGSRNVTRTLPHYNLDMIISLGYRVKSKTATQFRRWATERLKEYLVKGFTLDDERLKNLGGGSYWYELLERIRDPFIGEGDVPAGAGFVLHKCRLRPEERRIDCVFQNGSEQVALCYPRTHRSGSHP